eukprot:CAMPEP_0168499090 /NCGR_PEP_ID=MMETSP0228-20121227/73603_1 /TAXON_ID=133427 /ORGANISM="Protoceratium reticulatum, Strain CCCM 535 (=CCMP 1889)" /LENGTH=147 /DNA_ID=CAMNT_0008515989 /DNA_START=222 /DNA_END=663 /DNA_ORIENTATION=+
MTPYVGPGPRVARQTASGARWSARTARENAWRTAIRVREEGGRPPGSEIHAAQIPRGPRFVQCVDVPFQANPRLGAAEVHASVAACAAGAGLDFAAIGACFAGAEGDGEVAAQAMATPSHPFCPYVLVDGRELLDRDALLGAVCAAH